MYSSRIDQRSIEQFVNGLLPLPTRTTWPTIEDPSSQSQQEKVRASVHLSRQPLRCVPGSQLDEDDGREDDADDVADRRAHLVEYIFGQYLEKS